MVHSSIEEAKATDALRSNADTCRIISMNIAHRDGVVLAPSHIVSWWVVVHQTRILYETCVYPVGVGGAHAVDCQNSAQ